MLAALLKARVPTPSFVKLAAPETSPLKVSVLLFTVTVLFPGRATAPLMVIELVPAKIKSEVKVSTLVAVNAAAEASRVPPLTVIAPVPAAAALPKLNVPLDTVSPPAKVFAPERVNVPVLLTEPAPEMIPEEVPPAMVAVFVVAIDSAPPLRVEMVALSFAVNVPPDIVVTVAAPVEVTVPAESVPMVAVPAIFVVPAEIVVTFALLEKVLVPAPAKLVAAIEPVVPVKLTLPALVTVPTVIPVPETLAVALAATVSAAEEL